MHWAAPRLPKLCGFHLPDFARYSYLRDLPENTDYAQKVVDAMKAVEDGLNRDDFKGVLPQQQYFKIQTDITLLKSLFKIFDDIPDEANGDILGKIYEYFLGKFALSEGQGGGDESVLTDDKVKENWLSYRVGRETEIDPNTLDFDDLQTKYRDSPYKSMEVAHLREFIENKLQELLAVNFSRKSFVESLQSIINEYNSGGRTTEQAFEDLNLFKNDLAQEEQRNIVEGLTKEELELFDLLYKEKLTTDERIAVKNAAKALLWKLRKLGAEKPFWYKNTQEQAQVKGLIINTLNDDLPESYDKPKICDDAYNLVYERTLSSGNAFYH